MGLISGLPGYLLLWRDGDDRLHAVFLELKAQGGEESLHQGFFATWCDAISVRRLLCYSSDEALDALSEMGAFR